MTIHEACKWLRFADYTPSGHVIFNENKPEGKAKAEALKTIFEAAKNGEIVALEVFGAVRKERNDAVERLSALESANKPISDALAEQISETRQKICDDYCKYTTERHHGRLTQEALDDICEVDCPLSKL